MTPRLDTDLAVLVVSGLETLGMPSPRQTCDVAVLKDGSDLVAVIAFPALRVAPHLSNGGLLPWVSIRYDHGRKQLRADQRDWATRIVPAEALARARREYAEQGFAWPREWPRVETAPAVAC